MRSGMLVAVLAAFVFVGCGGDEKGGDITAKQVIKGFYDADGNTLVTLDDDEVWTTLVPDPKDSIQERYGPVTIYVIKKDGGQNTLVDGTKRKDGFFWKQDAGGWTMTKRYGNNVYAQYAGLPEQRPPAEGYPDVDEVLTRVAAGDLQ